MWKRFAGCGYQKLSTNWAAKIGQNGRHGPNYIKMPIFIGMYLVRYMGMYPTACAQIFESFLKFNTKIFFYSILIHLD